MAGDKPILKLKGRRRKSDEPKVVAKTGRTTVRARTEVRAAPQGAGGPPPAGKQARKGASADARTMRKDARKKPDKAPQPPPAPKPRYAEVLARLQAHSPELWDPARPRPLAIGIHEQLLEIAPEIGVSRNAIRRFLYRWTTATAYRRALSEPGAQRFNLDGTAVEPVLESHQERAREILEQGSGSSSSSAASA